MNNYEYIIASLPVPDSSFALDAEALVASIKDQCSPADNKLLDFLLDGFKPANLDRAFYERALKSRNSFIREYFLWDLRVRNTKTVFLNERLERPSGEDVIDIPGGTLFDEEKQVLAVLSTPDILQRERGLDKLMWDKAEDLTLLHNFDIDVILAFVARIMITDRWNKLDPESGRAMFRSLVEEIRQTRLQ